MQVIKDLVCSDDPVNHQLGLMLAFTEYGKSFETFMMVLDWHSCRKRKSPSWFSDITVSDDLVLYINWAMFGIDLHFIDGKDKDINLNCFIQYSDIQNEYAIFRVSTDESIKESTKHIKQQLKSIYHFLTYYDII